MSARPTDATEGRMRPHPRPAFESLLASCEEAAEARGGPRHFFISAHPRSGTNWLGSLLNLHPRVLCVGEFTFHDVMNAMNAFVGAPGRAASREPARSAACASFRRLVRECLRSCGSIKPGATVIGDHTPRRLRVFLPDATYIALFRDGRDVVVSWTYNALARREEWVAPTAVKSAFSALVERFHAGGSAGAKHEAAAELLNNEAWVRHSARVWAEQVIDDLDAVERIRDGRLPGRVEVVRYEDLHAETTRERDRLLKALGVDPAEAEPVGSQPRTAAGFGPEAKASQWEDPTSHYRRGVVGDWREKLSQRAVGWVEGEAGIALAALGYGMASGPAPRGLPVAISAG